MPVFNDPNVQMIPISPPPLSPVAVVSISLKVTFIEHLLKAIHQPVYFTYKISLNSYNQMRLLFWIPILQIRELSNLLKPHSL